jgi:hypothetical protein
MSYILGGFIMTKRLGLLAAVMAMGAGTIAFLGQTAVTRSSSNDGGGLISKVHMNADVQATGATSMAMKSGDAGSYGIEAYGGITSLTRKATDFFARSVDMVTKAARGAATSLSLLVGAPVLSMSKAAPT